MPNRQNNNHNEDVAKRISANLDNITTEEQGLLTAIGIKKEDLAAPRKSRRWTPISYANEKLQFKRNIKIPSNIYICHTQRHYTKSPDGILTTRTRLINTLIPRSCI